MSVCLSRCPIDCRAFLNYCALMCCLVLCFSGFNGDCFCCRMCLLYFEGAVVEVDVSDVAVDFRFCTSRFHLIKNNKKILNSYFPKDSLISMLFRFF